MRTKPTNFEAARAVINIGEETSKEGRGPTIFKRIL